MQKPKRAECLESWSQLMQCLPVMSNVVEVKALLDYELGTEKRISFVKRLHSRYTKLRQAKELKEYEEACNDHREKTKS